MTTLTELAAMLDAATGPSREIDALIFCALNPKYRLGKNSLGGTVIVRDGACTIRLDEIDPYTRSIDAALALVALVVPDSTGNHLSWRQRDVGNPGWCGYWASLVPAGEKTGGRAEAYAPTVPLAILEALVAALIAQETTNE